MKRQLKMQDTDTLRPEYDISTLRVAALGPGWRQKRVKRNPTEPPKRKAVQKNPALKPVKGWGIVADGQLLNGVFPTRAEAVQVARDLSRPNAKRANPSQEFRFVKVELRAAE